LRTTVGIAVILVGVIVGFLLGAATTYSGIGRVVTEQVTMTQMATTAITVQPGAQDLVQYCFSPGGDCANLVIYWIGRANSSIHVLIYSFTLDTITAALIQAKQAKPNLDVKIVWDESNVNGTGSEYQRLKSAGFNIRVDHRGGLLHDKVAIIDSHIILTGSFNWSDAANKTNRENLIVLDSNTWASAYEQNFQQIWAGST
jgi:phospholipase D